MLDEVATEAYDEFVSQCGKPDIIVLAGTNPKKKIVGEACKALLPFPPPNGKPMGYHVVKAVHESGLFGKMIIVGPSERLEQDIGTELSSNGIDNYVIVEESDPGGPEKMMENAILGTEHADGISGFVGVVSSDIPEITPQDIRQIYNDIALRLMKDKARDMVGELYHSLGLQSEDLIHYSGIRSRDRPGMLLYGNTLIRPGSCNLASLEIVNKLEGIADLMSVRKIKDEIKRPVEFLRLMKERCGFDGLYTASAGILNTWKMSGSLLTRALLFPIPYINVTIDDLERGITRGINVDVRFVISSGSADIDNVLEYDAAANHINGVNGASSQPHHQSVRTDVSRTA